MALNPFRIRGFTQEDSQLLLLSVLALYAQHQVNIGNTQPTEALEKRSQVSEMLSRALQDGESSNKNSCILESILILITLDVIYNSTFEGYSMVLTQIPLVYNIGPGPLVRPYPQSCHGL